MATNSAVRAVARQLAIKLIKEGIKKEGYKVSHYAAKDISKAATQLLKSPEGDAIMRNAKRQVEVRA